jgi:hypothetical protein
MTYESWSDIEAARKDREALRPSRQGPVTR